MLGSFGLGDVTADAEGMLPVERENPVLFPSPYKQ
jgi:hypothetical protein